MLVDHPISDCIMMVHVEVVAIDMFMNSQRLKHLKEHCNAPAKELENTEREVSRQQEVIKEYETKANDRERKLNQLQKEGSFDD